MRSPTLLAGRSVRLTTPETTSQTPTAGLRTTKGRTEGSCGRLVVRQGRQCGAGQVSLGDEATRAAAGESSTERRGVSAGGQDPLAAAGAAPSGVQPTWPERIVTSRHWHRVRRTGSGSRPSSVCSGPASGSVSGRGKAEAGQSSSRSSGDPDRSARTASRRSCMAPAPMRTPMPAARAESSQKNRPVK